MQGGGHPFAQHLAQQPANHRKGNPPRTLLLYPVASAEECRFLRSEHPERVDKSPAELLTGQEHAHWLELLGLPDPLQN